MSDVSLDVALGRYQTSSNALQHLSYAYQCINQNLQKHEFPTDTTIAAVVTMAIHEDLRGQPNRGKVHVDALQRIVQLRGGIDRLETHRVLVQKICRADIEYALHTGSRPYFNRDDFPRDMIQSMLAQSNIQEIPLSAEGNLRIDTSELRSVFVDSYNVCQLLNSGGTRLKFDPYAYQDTVISVCYRLLHYATTADDGPEADKINAYQLGLLSLMTTLLFQYDRSQRLSYDLLAGKLRETIEMTSRSESMDGATFLWLLFVGGISVIGTADRPWLLLQIKKHLSKLNVRDWPSVRDKIKHLPWVDATHEKPGRDLWKAAFYY